MSDPHLLHVREVCRLTSLSRRTVYRLMEAGDFPRPVQISPGRVAWRTEDVEAWCLERRQGENPMSKSFAVVALALLFILPACNAHQSAGFSQGLQSGYVTGYNIGSGMASQGRAQPLPYPPPRPVYQVPYYGSGTCTVSGNTRQCY